MAISERAALEQFSQKKVFAPIMTNGSYNTEHIHTLLWASAEIL